MASAASMMFDPFGIIKLAVDAATADLQAENDFLKDRVQELECQLDEMEDYKFMYEGLL